MFGMARLCAPAGFVHHWPMSLSQEERREPRRRSSLVVPDFATGSAAADFHALGR
jgi:hypothetical protein